MQVVRLAPGSRRLEVSVGGSVFGPKGGILDGISILHRRVFAVTACGGAVKGWQEAALYVERLRARRVPTPIYTYGGKVWRQMTAFRENRVVQSFV
jgi:hypothetical protein